LNNGNRSLTQSARHGYCRREVHRDPEELHRALAANGKLILVEAVVPSGSEPHFSKFMDLNMLVMTGGHERTEAEFRRLYEVSGFRLTRIVGTESPFSVIKCDRRRASLVGGRLGQTVWPSVSGDEERRGWVIPARRVISAT